MYTISPPASLYIKEDVKKYLVVADNFIKIHIFSFRNIHNLFLLKKPILVADRGWTAIFFTHSLTLAQNSRFLGWEINLCIKLGYRLAYLFGPIMEWSLKIRNLSLSNKIFGHCPPVPENSIRPFSIWLQRFSFFKWSSKILNLKWL